jgi:3-deoxy-D-manno-octulosonic-acid transferase
VAASTHEGEESVLLDALTALRARWPDLLLVLVPRHPQRFDAVAALLDRRGLAWQRRSALADGQACAPGTAVLLGDTMGELHAWYGAAELAFIGGSLIERGGHSPLEAMACGTPIVSGPHVFNFAEVFERLRAESGVALVDDAAALAPALDAWLADPAAARASGARARALFERERGAGARSLAALLALLDRLPPQAEVRGDAVRLLADAERAPGATPHWLDPAHWPVRQPVQGSGRGSAWFVQAEGLAAVLRHYRRGGLAGRLLGDRYARRPGGAPRALAEFSLLRRLRAWGLPVPRPLVGRATRHGMFERCDLLVERIPGGRNLAQRLQQAPLTPACWHAIGAAIGRLHACGVRHGDLNCHNLLLDADERPWILDFDGSRVVDDRSGGAAQDMPRLLRSLRKEAGRLSPWHWDEARDGPPLQEGHAEGLAAAGRAGTGAG